MIHRHEHRAGIEHNLVAAHAFDVRHEADAAAIVFELRIVQAVFFGRSDLDSHESFPA
jgi:hypothetical protein